MIETLAEAELFAGIPPQDCRALGAVATTRLVGAGQTVFRAGDPAEELFVLKRGRVELTFPLVVMGETRDTRFQSLEAGRTLAWSALVPPHRLTMSARATTEAELIVLPRARVLAVLAERPDLGYTVMSRLARVVATRLQEMGALWVREVQRTVSQTYR